MKILVTGAKGFVGRNLVENLKNIRDGKDRTHKHLTVSEIYEFDMESSQEELDAWCSKCDFVFHLAGVNRPKDENEYMEGNYGFSSELLLCLKMHGNKCPVMLSSSVQASLEGRFADSEYGKSKLAGERLFFDYEEETGSKVLVYRFPNVFGKWCRPNYNSAIATFCNAVANDLPYTVNDRNTLLDVIYIDDLIEEMICALQGCEHREGIYCIVPMVHRVTLGEIVDDLQEFAKQPATSLLPLIPDKSFKKKLYSTYLSYLPERKIKYAVKMNCDERGSFSELLRTSGCGQISVNVSKPGVVKGQHWHNSKWEFFAVVAGSGLIQQRKIGSEEIIECEVSGEKIEMVHMLPGYTHNIINLSDTEDLVTVMWANEIFNEDKPDTFREFV